MQQPPRPLPTVADSWFGHQLSWSTSTAVSLNLQPLSCTATHTERGKGDLKLGQSSLAPFPSKPQAQREDTSLRRGERKREDTLWDACCSHWGKKPPGHGRVQPAEQPIFIDFLFFFHIISGEEYSLNINLITWKHAQAYKDKDCHLRADGGYGLHVHGGGNGPLGSAQPAGEQSQWDLRGGPFRPVEAVQEAYLHQRGTLQGGEHMRTHQPSWR